MGSTSNEFKVRFGNHKSAMLTNKTTCELAVHFNRVEHQMSVFEFIVIEKLLMNVKITLIGVYSQGKLFGAPSCVLFIPTALRNDQSSTLRIELGLANKFYFLAMHF